MIFCIFIKNINIVSLGRHTSELVERSCLKQSTLVDWCLEIEQQCFGQTQDLFGEQEIHTLDTILRVRPKDHHLVSSFANLRCTESISCDREHLNKKENLMFNF